MIYGYNPTASIKRLRNAYKLVLILLMVNNVMGIALNPFIFLFSLMVVVGIPGAILSIHYTAAAMRKSPVIDMIIPPIAIIYNIIIYQLFNDQDISGAIIGGTIWPTLNIILSSIALFIAIAARYHSKAIQKK